MLSFLSSNATNPFSLPRLATSLFDLQRDGRG